MTLFRHIGVAITLGLGSLSYNVFADEEESVVNELAWGEALYFHFKDDKVEALTRLSARLSQGRLDKNRAEAELLLAGILLDYGLPTRAASLLDNLESLKQSPTKRAKMYLANARVFYQQQNYQAASDSLNRVDLNELSKRENTQARFMLAQIQFGLGQFALSAATLSQIEDEGNLQRYAKYNLGISLLNVDDEASQQQAVNVLSQVANAEIFDQEQFALADQAKLAMGMFAINQSRFEDAQQLLQSIRLDGLVSDDALLLLGWNAVNQNLLDQALGYWVTLAGQQDILSPVVQEAWLAVPYVWQIKGDKIKAKSGYETALKIQQQAQSLLDELKQRELWREILVDNNQAAIELSQALYQQLVADPAFYELRDQWLELQQLDLLLTDNARVVPVIGLAVDEQRDRFFNKADEAKSRLQEIDLTAFEQQIKSYDTQLDEQLSKPISEGLMNQEERSIWQRLNRSKATLSMAPDSTEMADKAEQVRRLNGVFYWEYNRDLSSKQWQATQSQQQLARQYEELKLQHDSLIDIVESATPPVEIDASKLTQLTTDINDLKQEINEIQSALEIDMSLVYQAFINERQQALTNLAEQANLSLARLSFEAATQGMKTGDEQ